jgi:hypothetical protein
MFYYLKISNNMNLKLNTIKQYKLLSFSTFTAINSKWQTITHDKALSRKKRQKKEARQVKNGKGSVEGREPSVRQVTGTARGTLWRVTCRVESRKC